MKIRKIAATIVLSAAVIISSYTGSFPSADSFCLTAEAASQLPAPKGIEKSVSGNTVTLKWKKVAGADAYRVYRYDTAKKKYIAYKDVTSRKCVIKGLEEGISHKFRIAALVKDGKKYRVQAKSAAVTVFIGSTELSVSSSDVSCGVWDTAITHTSRGEDRPPEISWDRIDGAEEYAVYMIDESAKNWLHWRAYGLTSNDPDTAAVNEYIGPYPPSGTHTYVVTVFALKKPADQYPGSFNAKSDSIESIGRALDISGGKSGNVIAAGSISGTYTHGE